MNVKVRMQTLYLPLYMQHIQCPYVQYTYTIQILFDFGNYTGAILAYQNNQFVLFAIRYTAGFHLKS